MVAGVVFGTGGEALVGQQTDSGPASRPWWSLWTVPARHDRLLLGMTTYHIGDEDREGWQNDYAIGLVARSVFAATFVTTHGDRALTAGFERAWFSAASGPHALWVGFRAGLMYGYDEELGWLAGAVPVLPYAQPLVYGRVGPLALDVGYTWVVLSVTASVAF